MRGFVAGVIIGLMVGAGVSYAAYTHIVWVDRNGNEKGTTSNPIYAEAI